MLLDQESMKKLLPKRHPEGSKFDHGVALMICGSRGMTGAAKLASMSALKSGAGMIHLASAASTIDLLSQELTEIVLHGLEENSEGHIKESACAKAIELAKDKQVVCIGPGLSHDPDTVSFVKSFLKELGKNSPGAKLILDADGINAFKDSAGELKEIKAEILITPHEGEFLRLFGMPEIKPEEKTSLLKKLAKEFKINILLKGAPSILATASEDYLLPYGNSGMATAGSGDVLSGIITSLAAQGLEVHEAGILGAYIHGEAGNRASEKLTEYSMIASDIQRHIPEAIKSLL